jgi:hypothetical protein
MRDDVEILRNKAAECERAAWLATDADARLTHRKRAVLYRELIAEVETVLATDINGLHDDRRVVRRSGAANSGK